MWLIGFFNLAALISGLMNLSSEPHFMIAVLVVVPITCFAELILLRIFCEIAVVVLLFPHYFKGSGSAAENNKVTAIEDRNDSDLDVSVHRQLV
jgi:hypothetical protein